LLDRKAGGKLEPLDGQASLAAAKTGHALLLNANRKLAARKLKYRIAYAEYYTRAESGRVGQQIFAFDVGNKHFGVSYVPGLERPSGGTTRKPPSIVPWRHGETCGAPTWTSKR
jgi:hypothetical protein